MTQEAKPDSVAFRRLFALARDLLQATDANSVFELVGRAFSELCAPDSALLLATVGKREYLTGFSERGSLEPVDRDNILFMNARRALSGRLPIVLPSLQIEQEPDVKTATGRLTVSVLALPFPAMQPVGALAALWHRSEDRETLALKVTVLKHLTEIAAAALGNIDFRLMLEQEMAAQRAEATEATQEYASEIRRRDLLEREKDRLAVTDVLTGMFNRRGFFLHGEQQLKLAHRQGTTSAIIFADIDGLKGVNDKFGHDIGDRLIQAGAIVLRQSFRDSDVVARLGGDEFAAFALDSGQPEAILKRIDANIEDFNGRSAVPYRLSFSIGIVSVDPAMENTLNDYLRMADKRMYAEKQERRASLSSNSAVGRPQPC